jgi:subtilisin family serine protease
LDTGIDSLQPDLASAVSGTSDLTPRKRRAFGADESSDSHGTAVAGIIAARGSATGAIHMAGLAPQASLLDIRVAVQQDHVSPDAVALGIRAAAGAAADVINVSLIVPSASPDLDTAVTFAQSHRCLIVAAAGDTRIAQALADYPGVLVVTAVGVPGTPVAALSGGRADVSAPGAGLLSTGETNGRSPAGSGYVQDVSGTGFAAAYVSAATALLLSADRRLTPTEAGQLLVNTAQQSQDGSVPPAIDPLTAMDSVLGPPSLAPGGDDSLAVAVGVSAVAALVIAALIARIIAGRRRRAARLALRSFPATSWDQPW